MKFGTITAAGSKNYERLAFYTAMRAIRYPINWGRYIVPVRAGEDSVRVHVFDDEPSAVNFMETQPVEERIGPFHARDPDAEPSWANC